MTQYKAMTLFFILLTLFFVQVQCSMNAVEKKSSCGGIIFEKDSGVISSPQWPEEYAPNLTCRWTIYIPDRYLKDEKKRNSLQVTLSFRYFMLSDTKDSIKIYTYADATDTGSLRVQYSRDHPTFPVQLKVTDVIAFHIVFQSVKIEKQKGFILLFNITDLKDETKKTSPGVVVPTTPSTPTSYRNEHSTNAATETTISTTAITKKENEQTGTTNTSKKATEERSCGGIIYEKDSGVINSPKWLEAYADNLTCRWTIYIPDNYLKDENKQNSHQVTFTFRYFKLYRNNLKIYSYANDTDMGSLRAQYSGDYAPVPFQLKLTDVIAFYIEFQSVKFDEQNGFNLMFNITNLEGEIKTTLPGVMVTESKTTSTPILSSSKPTTMATAEIKASATTTIRTETDHTTVEDITSKNSVIIPSWAPRKPTPSVAGSNTIDNTPTSTTSQADTMQKSSSTFESTKSTATANITAQQTNPGANKENSSFKNFRTRNDVVVFAVFCSMLLVALLAS